MQQIERYGVLALLLLVVTLVTVGLWGPDPTQAGEPNNRAGADQRTASAGERAARPNRRPVETQNANPRGAEGRRGANAQGGSLPLNNRQGNQAAQQDLRDWENQQRNHAPITSQLGQPAGRDPAPDPIRRDRQEGATQPGPAGRSQGTAQARPVSNQPVSNQPVTIEPRREVQVPTPVAGPKYKVKPGDSLERIAKRQLGDAGRSREIAQLNGITNPDLIRIDQVLVLPAGAQAQPTQQPRSTPRARFVSSEVSGTRTYTVKPGDALSVIASRECGTKDRMDEILALNPGLQADRIRIGQKIQLPTGDTAVARSTPEPDLARAQSREDHRVAGLRAGLNPRGNSRVR